MSADSHFVSSLSCPICWELPEDAVETSCCNNVYCEKCLEPVNSSSCPQCRRPFKYKSSLVVRRLIGNMPVNCPFHGCNVKVAKSEMKEHESKCKCRLYLCPAPGCLFEGLRETFAQHLARGHEVELVKNADSIFKTADGRSSPAPTVSDCIVAITNASGALSRLGENGKYYCGRRTDGAKCTCCDGRCGPTNGCNCSSCMKLDVETRKLPKDWYVNREGSSCRVSAVTGKMYCGRRVMVQSYSCDGYCGPTDGPNCSPCRILQFQVNDRYASVWHS